MIEIYTSPIPNGIKILIATEELGLPYRLHLIDLAKGEQRSAGFLAVNSNGRILAIVDGLATPERPIPVFESGAILIHLAETYGRLVGARRRARAATQGWLFLQVAGLGPSFGNMGYFLRNPVSDSAVLARFQDEAERHMGLIEQRFTVVEWFNCVDYLIADIAHFCWVQFLSYAGPELHHYPAAAASIDRISRRPAVLRRLRACAND